MVDEQNNFSSITEKNCEIKVARKISRAKSVENPLLEVLDPVHTTPFSNENDTVLFRIRLPSTLQRSENGSFRKRSPEWNDLKTVLFENAVFLVWTAKTILSENDDVTTTTPSGCRPLSRKDRQTLSDGFLVDRCDFYSFDVSGSSFNHVETTFLFFKKITKYYKASYLPWAAERR